MRATWGAVLALIAVSRPMAAQQCSDGSPPPCAAARAAAKRAASPALDDRTWVVVPFDNVSRSSDLEWLTDGSVNLLYLDLSNWTDVHIVDDKRVADYVRDLPSTKSRKALSLNDGLAVAKRAGAGRLVMGTLLKAGNQTQISATVFDTRRGVQLRVVNERAPHADSIINTFGRLAPKILNVATKDVASMASIGTTRIDAYQEYLEGRRALNRFDAATAKQHLDKALQLDSTFALAHYALAIASVYDEVARLQRARTTNIATPAAALVDPARTMHANAAMRLGTSLPDRERALIAALVADVKGDQRRACELYEPLVRADSTDAEALVGLGQCLYKDGSVEFVNGDSTKVVFRTSWNAALRVLRRALLVDPTNHLAFVPILTMVMSPVRFGCTPTPPATSCAADMQSMMVPRQGKRYLALVERQGDSLVTKNVRDLRTIPRDTMSMILVGNIPGLSRRKNVAEARVAAEEWVAAGPNEPQARKALGQILLQQGMIDAAAEQVRGMPDTTDDLALSVIKLEIAIKSHRGAEARRVGDFVSKTMGTGLLQFWASLMPALSGHTAGYDSTFARALTALGPRLPPEQRAQITAVTTYNQAGLRAMLGANDASIVRAEDSMIVVGNLPDPGKPLDSAVVKYGPRACSNECWPILIPTLAFGLRLPRTSWVVFTDSAKSMDPRIRPALARSRGDSSALRRAALDLDSSARAADRALLVDNGSALLAAESFLVLGDSGKALDIIRFALDSLIPHSSILEFMPTTGVSFAVLWPREMLLRADLAAARGFAAEAREWYDHFLDLWTNPDPVFTPIVERARRARAALGR